MSTSGSIDFNVTKNDIITNALIEIEVLGAEETVSPDDFAYCSNRLNAMIKEWARYNDKLFNTTEAIVFLTEDSQSYTLSSSGAHASTTTVSTALASAASSGATSITVDSTTGMTVGDNIGIMQSDGTRLWTTISTLPGSNVITFATALTASAAIDATVYSYTTKLATPLEILDVRRLDENNTAKAMRQISRQEYYDKAIKSTAGDVNEWYYDKQLSSGVLYVWPVSDDSERRLQVTILRQTQDFDNNSDSPDFPPEWIEALTLNLAYKISRPFGYLGRERQVLQADAKEALMLAIASDQETAPVNMKPDLCQ